MIFGFDEFELDDEHLEVRRTGRGVKVDALVVRLLLVLVRNAQRLVTKEELVEQVWNGRAVADNVITVSMARLRKALGHKQGEREFVVTVYGRGYRFVRDVAIRDAALSPAVAQQASAAGTPFVGRERALTRLRRMLGETRAGRGRMCALMGEPGIGKTRLVEVLEREVQGSQMRVAWGYCPAASDTPPLWPWLRLLRDVKAAAWTPELQERLGPYAADVRALLRETETRPADTAAAVLQGTDAARHRSFDAILRTLALASEQQPWLIVLDDLHRADSASIELLNQLLDEIAHTRILLIATLRHARGRRAPRPDTNLPQVLGHANCERVTLERLGASEVGEYVAALVDDPGGELGRQVFAKSEGNPFFMSELARQLQDGEQLDPQALTLSETARDLVHQNLQRLDPQTCAVLSAAAVIGRSFELPLLAAITERHPSAVMASLDEALAAEVVVAAPDSMTAFAFGHELLRDVLYDALTPVEQRSWHLRTAHALEQRAAVDESITPAELAYHFHAALPEGDLRKTVDYCRKAAAAAGAVFANADVIRYLRHALEALDLMDQPSVRLRANLLYISALYARGDANVYPPLLAEVMRVARVQEDGRLLISAASMLNPHHGFAPLPGGNDALRQALGLLAEDDIGNRATALAALASVPPQCYDRERCEALLDESVALARKSGSRTALRIALNATLHLAGGPAYDERTALLAVELEQIAQQEKRRAPVLPVQIALHRALGALQRGDGEALRAEIEHAAARCRDLRHGELLWHSERFRALDRINTGHWSEGMALLMALHRRTELRPILGTEAFCAFDRVVVFGDLAGAAALDDAVRSALDFETPGPPSIWSLKVRALSSAGLVGEARAALRAVAPGDLQRLPCDASYLGTLGHIARAALSLQALDYADAIYPLLLPYPERFAGHVSFLCEGSVSQLLGMLALALGRHAEAAAHLEAGVAANERAGFRPRATEARLQLAQCLIARGGGNRERAFELAREAREEAVGLSMQRLARDAAAVLGAPGRG